MGPAAAAAAAAAILAWLVAQAGVSAAGTPPLEPTPWPLQFHASLVQTYEGKLASLSLWYDWPNGRNMNIIRDQLSLSPLYDVEWTNGTSFFFRLEPATCRSAHVPVGVLRPDWLRGAEYGGRETLNGFDCHVWRKADFITYWEDVATAWPVRWIFYTGRIIDVLAFEEGAALSDGHWQAPVYCFTRNETRGGGAAGSGLLVGNHGAA